MIHEEMINEVIEIYGFYVAENRKNNLQEDDPLIDYMINLRELMETNEENFRDLKGDLIILRNQFNEYKKYNS